MQAGCVNSKVVICSASPCAQHCDRRRRRRQWRQPPGWARLCAMIVALKDIAGHRGAYLLRRETEGRVDFLAVTLWESMDSVRQFAGPNPALAVVEPDALAVLADYDDFVRHYEVANPADFILAR